MTDRIHIFQHYEIHVPFCHQYHIIHINILGVWLLDLNNIDKPCPQALEKHILLKFFKIIFRYRNWSVIIGMEDTQRKLFVKVRFYITVSLKNSILVAVIYCVQFMLFPTKSFWKRLKATVIVTNYGDSDSNDIVIWNRNSHRNVLLENCYDKANDITLNITAFFSKAFCNEKA